MNECERCIYSREIEVDVDSIESLIERKRERFAELQMEPTMSRNFYVEGMYVVGISELERKVKESKNMITCHRFPESVKKDKTDFCGEYVGHS